MKLLKILLITSIFSIAAQAFIIIKPKSIEEAKKTEVKISLGGEKSKGNENYQNMKVGAYVSFGNGETYKNLIIGSYKFQETNDIRSVNKGLVHYRHTRKASKNTDNEYFIQDEFDEFTNEKNRFLVGYNKRLQISLISKKTYLGNGILYSHILPLDTKNDKKQVNARLNLYLISTVDVAEHTTLSGLVFYQPSLYNFETGESVDFTNFKVNSRVSLENKITKSLSIEIGAIYNYNSTPFTGIVKEDFKTSIEINYKIPVE